MLVSAELATPPVNHIRTSMAHYVENRRIISEILDDFYPFFQSNERCEYRRKVNYHGY